MDGKLLLTEGVIRREALAQFAALTRHKKTPEVLGGNFGCELSTEPSGDQNLSLRFAGKRSASAVFPASKLELSLDDFSAEVLKPLAKALLVSAG